jgi:pimeloyl-ACP methyl ester carboxylesterase
MEAHYSPALAIQKVEVRGLKASWLEAGDRAKPILLCLHGYPDTARVWQPLFEQLQTEFHLVAPFLRGCEREKVALQRFSRDSQSLDLLEVLSVVNSKSKPVYVLGHDIGAVHAWHLAGLLGSQLKGLIVVNGLSLEQYLRRLKNPRQVLKSWYIAWMQIPGFIELVVEKAPWVIQIVSRSLGQLKGRAPEISRYGYQHYRALLREAIKAAQKKEMKPRLRAPVLVLWGMRDAFLTPPTHDEFLTDADSVEVRLLENENHWFFFDNPVPIAGWIKEFSRGPLC